ncbi:MAG: hypothetical protein NC120_13115 [Ruminococcus sp.]|nr:hypothetical protein [Ruminococcus sp.]
MKSMKPETVKVIGTVVSVIGAAATLIANWASDRVMNDTIKSEVAKAVKEYSSRK